MLFVHDVSYTNNLITHLQGVNVLSFTVQMWQWLDGEIKVYPQDRCFITLLPCIYFVSWKGGGKL